MRKLFVLVTYLVSLLLLGAPAIHAQEATVTPDAGWPVEEQCVGAPTKPPKGWSYDGTILMTGYAGIHGVNAKWDTPRVAVALGAKDVWGGALSPDGKWYASPYGISDRDPQTYNLITTADQIHVYSTSNSEKYIINIPIAQFFRGDYGQIHWRDNNYFAYRTLIEQTLLIDSFTGKYEPIDVLNSLFSEYMASIYSYLSNDWTRAVYRKYTASDVTWHIFDIVKGEDLKYLPLAHNTTVVWMPDSSHFVAEMDNPTDGHPFQTLVLFDKQGTLAEDIFYTVEGYQIRDKALSSDGRYLAFSMEAYLSNYSYDRQLYIADFKEHRIINTCIKVGIGLAWSPDNSKIAFLKLGEGQEPVQMYDIETEKLYRVGYHTGSVIGWRADQASKKILS